GRWQAPPHKPESTMRTDFFTGLNARFGGLCLSFLLLLMAVGLTPGAAMAQTTTVVAEAAAPAFERGDVAWMLTAPLLVLMMVVPGLALFYGGLVRAKNVLSVLSQVLVVFSLVLLLWVAYGYSAVFSAGNAFFGSFSEFAFLKGFTPDSVGNTPIAGLPDLLFVAFQSTFAGI